ncbi:MAG: DUF4363 family protein [Oscillospiraceae bacterium]|nr:DUF4363 family protein [Oscillospiraceae bacterium]
MKRVYLCGVLFIAVIAYSIFCQVYVSRNIHLTTEMLSQAAQERQAENYAVSRDYADSAWNTWTALTKKSGFMLADLTVAADVTVSLSRVVTLSRSGETERFIEECAATILMLEHFLGDNQNFMDGVS